MSTIYLYIRKTGCIGTLVCEMSRQEATDIMKSFRKSEYQIGIFSGRSIDGIRSVYGEFAPFKEIKDHEYLLKLLKYEIKDEFIDRNERNNIRDINSIAKGLLAKKGFSVVNFEKEVTKEELSILSQVPYLQMSKRGDVEFIRRNDLDARKRKVVNLREFHNTDDLSSITDMYVACRKQSTGSISEYSLACWLRAGQIKAKSIQLEIFNKEKLKSSIHRLRALTLKNQDEFHYEVVEILSKCGIALVLVEKFENTNVVGATQWINDGKNAIIQLNLRGKRADSFWFTLFHELAHIIIHDSKDFHMQSKENQELEDEADNIAKDWLIPDTQYEMFKNEFDFSINSIESFSKRIGIAPWIVMGRLQHDNKEWGMYGKHIPKVRII